MKTSSQFSFDAQAQKAFELVNEGESLFITGKAGTGKTTLLKEILKRNEAGSRKNIVVLAPTGVAAENAGGMTMHHFFRLPMKPYLPEHKVLPSLYKLKPDVIEVVRNLDILVIDEVSMVRCDMLDAMDMILRHYRQNSKPFGGIQVVMIGDLYQLSPVVKKDEWEEMKKYYRSVYFFCSYVLMNMKYNIVELTKVYRQNDNYFVKLLNNIRVAEFKRSDFKELDGRYEPDFNPGVSDDVVTLMTHNRKAYKWNENMFSLLKGKTFEYDASAKGWYGEFFPAAYHLRLKVGARVMFLRNTEMYKNGTMGRVLSLEENAILVRKDDGNIVQVERAKWELLKYIVDKKKKIIYTVVSGTYVQYPLKLAWAVSIHKSQGLTFDEVAIDVSKAFASGQVYVALSRCRTLEGIHLLSPVLAKKILVDEIVKDYMNRIGVDGIGCSPDISGPINTRTLMLNISRRKFQKLESGETTAYKHSIDSTNEAQIFLHEKGKLCVGKAFKHIKKNWSVKDTNNGKCPFIQQQYEKVVFSCTDMRKKMEAEIFGNIEVYLNADNQWAFRFKVKSISNVSSF